MNLKTLFILAMLCIGQLLHHPIALAADAVEEPALSPAEQAAYVAAGMIGAPYKYRGIGPNAFDCSGLVRYSFESAGIETPHSTRELRKVSDRIQFTELQRGDLLFFNERRRRSSHVGIYLADGLFVHAPRRHERVRIDNLDDQHWKKRFSEARRIS